MATRYREEIIDQLKIISDPSEQYAYARAAPITNVPAELICQWDEVYRRFGPAGNLDDFSKSEREAIAEFHGYFDKHARYFPQEGGVDGLQKSPEWQQLQENARTLVTRLGNVTDHTT